MIDTKTYFFNPEIISIIEEKYGVKYICETCIKTKGYWRNEPSLIFYSKKPHPDGSNYLAVSRQNNSFILSDGISATEPFVGSKQKMEKPSIPDLGMILEQVQIKAFLLMVEESILEWVEMNLHHRCN